MMKSCFFTGHRKIKITYKLYIKLINTLETLIEIGIVDFYAGGAIGFDSLAELCVLQLKDKYPHIKLHLILPCKKECQTYKWSIKEKKTYDEIFERADDIEYITDKYFDGCMKLRNQKLVDYAECCVCYYNKNHIASGTGQTIRMAVKKGILIINLFI